MQLVAIVPVLATLVKVGVVQARFLGAELSVSVVQIGYGTLGARQVSIPNAPPECKSICDPVNAVIIDSNGACAPTACCTASFETGWFNCVKCVTTPDPSVTYSAEQQVLDALVLSCAEHGLALPKLTFPGQDKNRPLSTLVGGPSPTITQITSLPTTTAPNGPMASVPPGTSANNSGGRTSGRMWCGGMMALTVVSLLGGL